MKQFLTTVLATTVGTLIALGGVELTQKQIKAQAQKKAYDECVATNNVEIEKLGGKDNPQIQMIAASQGFESADALIDAMCKEASKSAGK